jgi:uncharacterized protein (TIGR00251 family)
VETEGWRKAVRRSDEEALLIDLYVEPGASETSLGPYDPWRQRIKARVKAPATGGKANAKLAVLLGDVLGAPAGGMRIVRGATTRRKTVAVEGVEPEAALEALARALGEGEPTG